MASLPHPTRRNAPHNGLSKESLGGVNSAIKQLYECPQGLPKVSNHAFGSPCGLLYAIANPEDNSAKARGRESKGDVPN